jgi:hypothetical protein
MVMWMAALDDVLLKSDRWHHIAMVMDANRQQGRLYIDGVRHHTSSCGSGPTDGINAEPLCFGRFGPQRLGLNGLLDEVRIYRRALSDAEIAALVPDAKINAPPKVTAGVLMKATMGEPVALNGTLIDESAQPSSRSAAWSVWRKLLGPGTVQFDDVFAQATQVRFSAPGEYLLELRHANGAHVVWDTVRVSVSAASH